MVQHASREISVETWECRETAAKWLGLSGFPSPRCQTQNSAFCSERGKKKKNRGKIGVVFSPRRKVRVHFSRAASSVRSFFLHFCICYISLTFSVISLKGQVCFCLFDFDFISPFRRSCRCWWHYERVTLVKVRSIQLEGPGVFN